MTKQQQKVYDFIKKHPGATTKDIMLQTGIQCPSGRISELRAAGVDIQEVGTVKYPGSKAFVKYKIGKPLTKTISRVEIVDGVAVEIKETVAI